MSDSNGFCDPALAEKIVAEIHATITRPWVIMEVCGGQTHALLRHGLDQLLPKNLELLHGPGCPVCVTPVSVIDHALTIAAMTGVTFCTFGDMLRVPGSRTDLQRVKASGADVRVQYSPLDSLAIARANPSRQVVFFSIGFETTAPAHALAVHQAHREQLPNFSVLTSLVRVPPALKALLSEPDNRVRAILAAGHVCSVMGMHEYPSVAARYRVPIVVTGFEPLDLLQGILCAVKQLESGAAEVENAYRRAVTWEGNRPAQAMIAEVFEETDREWRGIGVIPRSGWTIREKYRAYDAEARFPIGPTTPSPNTICRSGEVLRGRLKPSECAAFGRECTPRTPLGATMVSAEGACAAYFHAGKLLPLSPPAHHATPATV
jgi:hydrogenase expression/formation protein HypD